MRKYRFVSALAAMSLVAALGVAAPAFAAENDEPEADSAAAAIATEADEVVYASDGVALPTPEEADELALSTGASEVLVPIYRLYQPATSEHLYTSSYNEALTLYGQEGWGFEGLGWNSPTAGKGVYRLYNPGLGYHLYTTSENERKVLTETEGWQYDNDGEPLYYSDGDVPVYRLYNEALGGIHHLTTSEGEYNALATMGWAQEGVSFEAGALPDTTFTYTRYFPQGIGEGLVNTANGVRYIDAEGNEVTGWITIYREPGVATEMYIHRSTHEIATGFFTYNDNRYFAFADGELAKYQFLETDEGILWADEHGVLSELSEAQLTAYEIAAGYGFDLRSCYDYCVSQTYDNSLGERDLSDNDPATWTDEEALRFYTESGDCFSYAAGFALLARACGYYNAIVAVGNVPGTWGDLVHGWTEIVEDGVTYVYDSNLENTYSTVDGYRQTYDSAAVEYSRFYY